MAIYRINKQKDKELEKTFSCSAWDLDDYTIKEYFNIVKKQNKKINKDINKNLPNQIKGLKSDSRGLGNTRILTRILTYLKEIKPISNLSNFRLYLCSSPRNIKDCLNWLVNNKILITTKINGTIFYKLNSKWDILE